MSGSTRAATSRLLDDSAEHRRFVVRLLVLRRRLAQRALQPGVANHFFYLLAQGTSAGVPSKTCVAGNTRVATGTGTVTGIGRSAAERIWYRALTTYYMTKSTTYAAARTATIKAANDLFGVESAQSNAVAAAWTAVGRS